MGSCFLFFLELEPAALFSEEVGFSCLLYQQNVSTVPWRSGRRGCTTDPQQVSWWSPKAQGPGDPPSVDLTVDTEVVQLVIFSFLATSINTWPVEACWWLTCAALTTRAGSKHINLPGKHPQTFRFKQLQLKTWIPLCWKSRASQRSVTGGQQSAMWSF